MKSLYSVESRKDKREIILFLSFWLQQFTSKSLYTIKSNSLVQKSPWWWNSMVTTNLDYHRNKLLFLHEPHINERVAKNPQQLEQKASKKKCGKKWLFDSFLSYVNYLAQWQAWNIAPSSGTRFEGDNKKLKHYRLVRSSRFLENKKAASALLPPMRSQVGNQPGAARQHSSNFIVQ